MIIVDKALREREAQGRPIRVGMSITYVVAAAFAAG